MLGFAMPILLSPVLVIIVIQSFTERIDFVNLYKILKTFTWIIVIASFIRYIFQIDIIPQGYIETIRNDGFRLSGFIHPDSIGYGRTLLIPLAFTISYITLKLKFNKDIFLLFLLIISLFMTYSRIIIATSIVIIIVVALYNLKTTLIIKSSLYLFIVIALLYSTGGIEKLTTRHMNRDNKYGINMSGRDIIYEQSIPIVISSPYVGLRPGGYVSMLKKGFTFTRNAQTSEMIVQSAHSFYLIVALDWGIPFLLILVGIMLHCVYLLHKTIRLTTKYITFMKFPHLRAWSIASIGLFIGLFGLGITDFVPYPIVFFLIGLSWSLYLIVKRTISLQLKSRELNGL